MQWYFDDWDALDQDNTRIWQTYYEPKPLSELYSGWQEMLAEHRQVIVEVQEIASATGAVDEVDIRRPHVCTSR